MRGESASLRGVVQGAFPGARRAMKASSAPRSTLKPEGSPSMTQPTPVEWDWPKTVTLRAVPKVEGISHASLVTFPPRDA